MSVSLKFSWSGLGRKAAGNRPVQFNCVEEPKTASDPTNEGIIRHRPNCVGSKPLTAAQGLKTRVVYEYC